MGSMADHETPDIPAGMRSDAHETWPPRDLIDSFLGNFDFEFRPGEAADIADTEAAQEAARKFRDTLGRYASGVTVITPMSGGDPVGMTCQSFSSISIHPALVYFIPARTSRASPLPHRASHFSAHLLTAELESLSTTHHRRGTN